MSEPQFTHGDKCIIWWRRFKPTFTYRNSSVPGIAKRGGYGNYYRYPRTQQEISNDFIPDEDIKALLTPHQIERISGQRRDLPTAWEDVPRRRNHSWKKHRKHQHR